MEEKVFFNNSKGDRLCGILNNPSDDKTKPIIILVHGFSSHKNTRGFKLLRELLEKNGYTTFRFDIFGHGESEGKFENLTISEAVDDILQSIQFIKSIGFNRIGLVGSSFGGNASEMAGSQTKDLLALVLKSPVSNYFDRTQKLMTKEEIQEWENRGFRMIENDGKKLKLNYSFYKDFPNNDGYKVASLIKIPTLIIHGDADKSVPVEQSIKISKIIPQCKLVLVKGADHTYTQQPKYEEMSNKIANFIFDHIQT